MQAPCHRTEHLSRAFTVPSGCDCVIPVIPKHSQLLQLTQTVKEGQVSITTAVWGVPFSPEEFVKRAIQAGHPSLYSSKLAVELKEAIRVNACTDPVTLAKLRTGTLKKWATRAKQLEEEEKEFKASLDPTVANILAPKKLLLWKSILVELGYPDMAVFDEVCQGVQLTGGVEVSGLFNLANKPATKFNQELKSSAPQLSKDILRQVRPQSPDVDQVVLRKTQDEVARGGPLSRPRYLKVR